MANLAANSIVGNNTVAPATPLALTAAQVKALLAIAATDVAGLGALATVASVNLSTQASGTLQAAQEPAHTGDVTNGAGSLALTVAAGAVSNAKLANMATLTIKGNNIGAAAAPLDLTVAQVKALLAITTLDVSGLGSLATASTINLGTQVTGTLLAAQAGALTGDVTSIAGSYATTISLGAVSNTKLASMAPFTFKANNSAVAVAPADLTLDQMQVALNLQGQMAANFLIMN